VIPSDLIVWTGGDAADDPQRRTVATAKPGPVTVSAQIAGVTKTVTINVVSVEIEDAGFVGKGQNTNIAVTITPSPLPAGRPAAKHGLPRRRQWVHGLHLAQRCSRSRSGPRGQEIGRLRS